MNDSMQVRDLIEQLQRFDPRAKVVIECMGRDEDGFLFTDTASVDGAFKTDIDTIEIRGVKV